MALDYGTGGNYTVSMAGPFSGGGGSEAKLIYITLPAANWKGGESPYYQVVEVEGVSVNSMVKLQLSEGQIEIIHDREVVSFTAVNDGGVVTVYAVGDKPQNDYIIQATVMEVTA